MIREKTFTIRYNYFEPDTMITPTSRRCPLKEGRVYKVQRCIEPSDSGDDAVVLVEGRTWAVSTYYFREATVEEIAKGEWEVDW